MLYGQAHNFVQKGQWTQRQTDTRTDEQMTDGQRETRTDKHKDRMTK